MGLKKRKEFEVWKVNQKYLVIEFFIELRSITIDGNKFQTSQHLSFLDWYEIQLAVESLLSDNIKQVEKNELSIVLENNLLLKLSPCQIKNNLLAVMELTDQEQIYDFYLKVDVMEQKPKKIGLIEIKNTFTGYDVALNGYQIPSMLYLQKTDVEEEYVPTSKDDHFNTQKYIPKPTVDALIEPYKPEVVDKSSPVAAEKYVPSSCRTKLNEYTPELMQRSGVEDSRQNQPDKKLKINATRSHELFGESGDEQGVTKDDDYAQLMKKYERNPGIVTKKGTRSKDKASSAKINLSPKPTTSTHSVSKNKWLKYTTSDCKRRTKVGGAEKRARKRQQKQKETSENIRRLLEEAENLANKNAEFRKINEAMTETLLPLMTEEKDPNREKKMLPEYTINELRDLYETYFKEDIFCQVRDYLKSRQSKPHPHVYDIQSLTSLCQISHVMDLLHEKLSDFDEIKQQNIVVDVTALVSEQLTPYVLIELYKRQFNLNDEEATFQAQWQAKPLLPDSEFQFNDSK